MRMRNLLRDVLLAFAMKGGGEIIENDGTSHYQTVITP